MEILEAKLDTDGVYKVVGIVDPWQEKMRELLGVFNIDYAEAEAFYEKLHVERNT